MVFQTKLKGGALYITVVICMIIGIILGLFILIGSFNQRKVAILTMESQLEFDLISAINIAGSDSKVFSDYYWRPVGERGDSIRLKKILWGAYDLVVIEAKNQFHQVQKSGFYGLKNLKGPAIMTTDKGRPINLCGNINITGTCYFPKSGYRASFLEGQPLIMKKTIEPSIRQAPIDLPKVKTGSIESIQNAYSQFNPVYDSLINKLPEVLKNDFSKKTLVFQKNEKVNLAKEKLAGNIKVISSKRVVIDSTSELEDVLICAPVVIIRKGFKGCIHILAKDSIVVEKNCELVYPSSLTVFKMENEKAIKSIIINDESTVAGAVLCLDNIIGKQYESPDLFIKLGKMCAITGMIYSSGFAQIQGTVSGNVYCDKLSIRNSAAIYDNYLMNCEINSDLYSNEIIVPSIFEIGDTYTCCKWL